MKRNFTAPTVEELAAYAREIGFKTFKPQAFLDHYEMVGWVVGRARTPMASWRAAVRTWQRNQAEWAGQPLPGAKVDPAVEEYTRQVRACLAGGGVEIGRLYAKIADAIGAAGLEEVRRMARRVDGGERSDGGTVGR
jgi:hypothetical protein